MKRWSTGLGEGPDTIEPAGGVEAGDSEDVDGDPGVMNGSTMTNTRRKNCPAAPQIDNLLSFVESYLDIIDCTMNIVLY